VSRKFLLDMIRAQKTGQAAGVTSICSANRYVLEAAMFQAKRDNTTLLIEATSNQVDQFGGYTGMTPADFVAYVSDVAAAVDFPVDRIALGGDHLGPNRWQDEPAEAALAKARDQVSAYVAAGFTKIHLDASMRLGDDPGDAHTPPAPEVVAQRAADLCAVAEAAAAVRGADDEKPLYVIGTEVPIPGGAQEELEGLQVTKVTDAARTIELNRQAFARQSLETAWDRVVAVVVQPGVEFGDTTVVAYNRAKARDLSRYIETESNLVYEAHSTDYQQPTALRQLVEDHFAILKVGPWLTFALREALFALASMEQEWLVGRKFMPLSNLRGVVEHTMVEYPEHWKKHYHGSAAEQAFARRYSYSDRIRYYWPRPEVAKALELLLANLSEYSLPLTLLGQYMPSQYRAVEVGEIRNNPVDLIHHKIMEITGSYARACGHGAG